MTEDVSSEEVEDILENAENMLRMANAGLNQYQESEGEAKIPGLRNAVVFGRSVTFVLQQLRGKVEPDFDEWYGERVEVLKENDTLSYMTELRNQILKEGFEDVGSYAKIDYLNTNDLHNWAPNYADNIFIGDQYGGSGWTIEQPDGTEIKFYADLPDEVEAEVGLTFSVGENKEPTSELRSAEEDLKFYIRVLAEMVDDAKKTFGDGI